MTELGDVSELSSANPLDEEADPGLLVTLRGFALQLPAGLVRHYAASDPPNVGGS